MTTRRTNRSIVRRMIAVLAGSIAAVTALSATANAADYDSATGFLKTASGATATVGMNCDRTGVLVIQKGFTGPQYFAYNATNSAGQSTGWTAWQSVPAYPWVTVVNRPGYWLVQVAILHWGPQGWTVDNEFAPVTSQAGPYRHRFYCNVLP